MSKPKVIKHFDKLDLELQTLIVNSFPRGFDKHLVTFKGLKGKLISALPFETEDKYYFVKMTREEAIAIYTGESFTVPEGDPIIPNDEEDNLEDEIPEEVTEVVGEDLDD